jgi:predicted ArsR family transcriptional regulator
MERLREIPKPKVQDKAILKTLLEHDYWLSTKEIAEETDMSWNTAKFHLDKLYEWGWVSKKNRGKKELWRAYR